MIFSTSDCLVFIKGGGGGGGGGHLEHLGGLRHLGQSTPLESAALVLIIC